MKINKRGISLITLVITIIIMIILAGAIILTLTNSGIFDKANDAVSKYSLKEVQSIADLAWAEAFADGARDKDSLQAAVDKALEDNDLDDKYKAVADEKGVTVTEIGEGSENQPAAYDYVVGDIVKVKDTEEYFYVIENSRVNDSEVLLFAAQAINTETLLQTEKPNSLAFSETKYWADGETNLNEEGIPDESHYVTRAAYDYAKSLDENASGRLLTLAEAERLEKENQYVLRINSFLDRDSNNSDGVYLGTLNLENMHVFILGRYEVGNEEVEITESEFIWEYGYSLVRPVVKIAKDKISGKRINVTADKKLSFGEEVRIGNEVFYVLKDYSKEERYVEILSKESINTEKLQQGRIGFGGSGIAFSSTNYWSSIDEISYPYDLNESGIPDESHYALRAAYNYGAKLGGAGRLLTYEEAFDLKDWLSSTCLRSGDGVARMFWLSSAGDDESVWTIWRGYDQLGDAEYSEVYTELRKEGYGKDLYNVWDDNKLEYIDFVKGERYDVLPVIRIDKTKLSYLEF